MKIQHKRSNVLDNGSAKEPTAAQMEYGELAVNYNEADPSLFIKDSADQIRKIGGDLDLYLEQNEADARYLRVDAGAPDQTRVAGKVTFAELSEHGGGIKLTGGDQTTVGTGLYNSGGSIAFTVGNFGRATIGSSTASFYTGVNTNYAVNVGQASENTTNIIGTSTSLIGGNGTTRRVFHTYIDPPAGYALGRISHYEADSRDFGGTADKVYGFKVNNKVGQGTTENYGFWSDLSTAAAGGYNFYASGTAPNWFAGSTYIGGSSDDTKISLNSDGSAEFKVASNNTLGAGSGITIAASSGTRIWEMRPAEDYNSLNLDVQWNGVWSSALSVRRSTKTLTANGGITVAGGTSSDVKDGIYTQGKGVTITYEPKNDGDEVVMVNAYANNPDFKTDLKITSFSASFLGDSNGFYRKFDEVKGFSVGSDSEAISNTVMKDNGVAYGFYGALTNESGRGQKHYNFYAAGDAPNFFAGDLILDKIKNAAGLGTDANGKIIATSGGGGGGGIVGSDYLRRNTTDSYGSGKLSIDSESSSGHYWGVGIGYNNSAWRHLNADSWGYAFRNSGGSLQIYAAKEAGTDGGVATYRILEVGGKDQSLIYDNNKVWHEGNDGSGSGLDADTLRGAAPATNSTANTIAKRDGSGDLTANNFKGKADNAGKLNGATESTGANANTIAKRDGSGNLTANLFKGTAEKADLPKMFGHNNGEARVIVCSGDDSEASGDYRRLKRSSNAAKMNGEGTFSGVKDINMSGKINGFQIVSAQKLRSGGNNNAMAFVSANGKYNFRDEHDLENFGQIQAGNVTFRSLNRIIGDETDPANFDADGDYIGPVQDLLSVIETLQQQKADLETRLAALEANEIIDDSVDSSLLSLVASLNARVTALETP